MDLKKEILPLLYQHISIHYENGLYSDAILDAVKALTDLVRTKSKVDGDGASLVGQAFGGRTPPLKLNRMQKISEIDEQKGFEQLLRGLYMGLRNPRRHEKITDTKEDCDSIILFINYLYTRVGDAESFFELEEFKKRVFDPLFVERSEYAEILANEIPSDEFADVAVTILKERRNGNPAKLEYFFSAVFNKADDDQLATILKAFSSELKIAQMDPEIINLVRHIKDQLWPRIDEDTKLRIESRMIDSVSKGSIKDEEVKGFLGTWANSLGEYFRLKRELGQALIERLQPSWYTQNYVGEYFLDYLPSIIDSDLMVKECCKDLAYATLGNNARILKSKLLDNFVFFPKTWRELILEYGLRYREQDKKYYESLQKMKDEEAIPF